MLIIVIILYYIGINRDSEKTSLKVALKLVHLKKFSFCKNSWTQKLQRNWGCFGLMPHVFLRTHKLRRVAYCPPQLPRSSSFWGWTFHADNRPWLAQCTNFRKSSGRSLLPTWDKILFEKIAGMWACSRWQQVLQWSVTFVGAHGSRTGRKAGAV